MIVKSQKYIAFEMFDFWLFPPIFVLLGLLFDRMLQFFKNFARNVDCDFLGGFQTLCSIFDF